jgi:beta propeller repeat protein
MKRLVLVGLTALAAAACDRDFVGPQDAALAPSFSVSGGSIVQLTSGESGQREPALSGNNLVYVDGGDIFLRDIWTGISAPIAVGRWQKSGPRISGNYVVWTDFRSEFAAVYLYDISKQETTQLTDHPRYQYAPQIDGNRIVWVDSRDGTRRIYLYDLTTRTERPITNHSKSVSKLSLSGDKVAWSDNGGSIYVSASIIHQHVVPE